MGFWSVPLNHSMLKYQSVKTVNSQVQIKLIWKLFPHIHSSQLTNANATSREQTRAVSFPFLMFSSWLQLGKTMAHLLLDVADLEFKIKEVLNIEIRQLFLKQEQFY